MPLTDRQINSCIVHSNRDSFQVYSKNECTFYYIQWQLNRLFSFIFIFIENEIICQLSYNQKVVKINYFGDNEKEKEKDLMKIETFIFYVNDNHICVKVDSLEM